MPPVQVWGMSPVIGLSDPLFLCPSHAHPFSRRVVLTLEYGFKREPREDYKLSFYQVSPSPSVFGADEDRGQRRCAPSGPPQSGFAAVFLNDLGVKMGSQNLRPRGLTQTFTAAFSVRAKK